MRAGRHQQKDEIPILLRSWQLTVLIIVFLFLTALSVNAQQYKLIIEADAPAARQLVSLEQTQGVIQAYKRMRRVTLLPQIAVPDGILIGNEIILNLFPDITYTATVDRVSVNVQGTITVRARIHDYPFAYLLISTSEKRSLGCIRIPEVNEEYHILYEPITSAHYLVDVDQELLDIQERDVVLKPPPIYRQEQEPYLPLEDRVSAVGDPNSPANIGIMVLTCPQS